MKRIIHFLITACKAYGFLMKSIVLKLEKRKERKETITMDKKNKLEESREKAPEGPSDALEDFGTKEDLETLLEVMRGLRDDVNGELNDSCVAGVRLVSVRAVDAPGAANYFRRARKDIDERTGLVRLSEIETNELFDKEIGVVVPFLSLRSYIKTGEKGLFARQMEKAQREVMKEFDSI